MDPQTVQALAEFFQDFGEEIEDVTLHGNDAIGREDMACFKKEAGPLDEWHYVEGATVLIRSVQPTCIVTGWQNRQLNPYFVADIWGD